MEQSISGYNKEGMKLELLKEVFGSVEEISPFIFALRTIVVGILLYLEGKVLPHRSGGQFAGYDFAFFWMMGRKTAEEFGVKNVFTDYREMLSMDGIDAVSVCVPNHLHSTMAIDAFEAGKHVICEKPLAITPAEGEAMVAAGKKAGKLFMTAFNNRFRGDTQLLKKMIESGELGDIYYAKTGWIRRKGIPGMGGWFTTKAKSGGGPLIDIGVHVLDLAMWLMGNPKAVTVSGSTYAQFGPKGEGLGGWGHAEENGTFDVEDLAAGFIRMDTGATRSR
jgi:predicted dehydrogenase